MAYGCGEYWPGQLDGEVYEWSLFCLTFVLPFLLLSFCYGRVARKLWTRNLPGNADPERDQEQAKNKRKTVRMLISVVVLFAICWLPMHSYNILMNFHPSLFEEKPMSTRIFRASVYIWLTMTDTIVNPIVYVFLSDRFRKDLKLMFIRSVRRCLPGRHGADGFSDYRSQYTTSMMETSPRTTRRTRLSPILAVVGRQGSNNSLTSKTASNGNFLTVAPYNDCLKRRGDAKIENAISEEDEKIDASKF
ncbi:RYamide receptor-like [Ptychodera flava]|uniref:RYamide receptor-like n=1 Tax=Ptychodera flava TaxID=63121 RepID=UPI00396A00CF